MAVVVLLADGRGPWLVWMQDVLERESNVEIVRCAASGREALNQLRLAQTDVALLDMTLPDMPGPALIRQALEASPDTAIIALVPRGDEHAAREAIQAGALGHVWHDSCQQRILLAIRAVASGEAYRAPTNCVHIDDRPHECSGDQNRHVLSCRERQVLKLVAEGLSSKEIAGRLFVTLKTVEWHRKSIMDKLSIRSVAGLTKYAVRKGLTTLETV